MIDEKGRICEYDGYIVPEKGEDTPENKSLREKAMKEFKEKARQLKAERMGQSSGK